MQFKKWVKMMLIVSFQPRYMNSETAEESDWLNIGGTNFAAWYRYISQEYQDKIFLLVNLLRDAIPGFHHLPVYTLAFYPQLFFYNPM
jgi:hypothetical protein